MWRIVLLASLGGTLEFYDFVIFGIFAKDIADAIFPNPTPLISLMVSFAAFAAGYLARPARRHRAQPLRRSLRPPPRVPGFDFRDVGRHVRHGPRAVIRHVGARRERADGDAPAHSGILSRWRVARRPDLRGRNRAATGAVGLRRGLLVRHAWGRGGDRGQSCRPHVAAVGIGGHIRMARGVPARRTGRTAEFRAAAVARRVARVRRA